MNEDTKDTIISILIGLLVLFLIGLIFFTILFNLNNKVYDLCEKNDFKEIFDSNGEIVVNCTYLYKAYNTPGAYIK